MAVDDPGDGVGEIGLGIDAAELAGFDERGDDGPVLFADETTAPVLDPGPGEPRPANSSSRPLF